MHLPLIRRLQTSARGDTIIEVLISIAVVSLVLSGAYVTTNRSLQATRAAQERSIALKLGESQLERIKGLMATPSGLAAIQGMATPFCIVSTTGLPAAVSGTVCDFDSSGASSNTTEPIFHISIVRSSNDFTLTATWTNVGGRNNDSLQLRYRVYG